MVVFEVRFGEIAVQVNLAGVVKLPVNRALK